jgi:hypothetical protein
MTGNGLPAATSPEPTGAEHNPSGGHHATATSTARPAALPGPDAYRSRASTSPPTPTATTPNGSKTLRASGHGHMTRGGKQYTITNPRHLSDEDLQLLPKQFSQFEATVRQ